MDARVVARALVDELFPGALAAFLGVDGQIGPPELLVLLSGEPAPFRQSLVRESWSVELIGHTPASLSHGFTAEARRGEAQLLRLCAQGTALVDTVGVAARVQADASRRIQDGPAPAEAADLDGRCRELAGLLAELAVAVGAAEVAFLGCVVLDRTAELYLATEPHWMMSGESAQVRLARAEPRLHEQLVAAVRQAVGHGRGEALRQLAESVLARAGGDAAWRAQPAAVPPAVEPVRPPALRPGPDRSHPRRSSAGWAR